MTLLEDAPVHFRSIGDVGPHPLASPPVFRGRGAGGEGAEVPRADSNQPGSRVWFVAGLLLLTGLLILAHGCHGDEDTELFTSFSALNTH